QEHDSYEMCSVCNENPALPGKDMCIFCLKEMGRADAQVNDEIASGSADLDLEGVSNMEEIAMDIEDDEIPPRELGEIDRELSLEEAVEEEEVHDEEEDEDE
ncbi:MAG TPA: hypothetical protein PKE04_17640, partial [Clostridia bacterium]|nr:hypothetical protein [Clostridia bacterium]